MLSVKYNTGQLFTVNIADKTIREIVLPKGVNIVGADGLSLYKEKYVIIVHNAGNDGITFAELNRGMTRVVNAKTMHAADFKDGIVTESV